MRGPGRLVAQFRDFRGFSRVSRFRAKGPPGQAPGQGPRGPRAPGPRAPRAKGPPGQGPLRPRPRLHWAKSPGPSTPGPGPPAKGPPLPPSGQGPPFPSQGACQPRAQPRGQSRTLGQGPLPDQGPNTLPRAPPTRAQLRA